MVCILHRCLGNSSRLMPPQEESHEHRGVYWLEWAATSQVSIPGPYARMRRASSAGEGINLEG